MIRLRTGLLLALGTLAIAPTARAQFNNLPPGFNGGTFDPFSAYYGYYLPRNQTVAAQLAGGANETINLNAQARRAAALTTRPTGGSLYELDNPYEFVPLEDRPFTRPPTVLQPGQPAGPYPATHFGRSASRFYGYRSGAPGSVRGNPAARLPTSGVGRGRMGGMGRMGGGMGGFGGFGGGFR